MAHTLTMAAPHRHLRPWHYVLGSFFLLLVTALVILHFYLNAWLLDDVNRKLDHIGVYHGSVESIEVNLYRGAYQIHGLKIVKSGGHIPVPFIAVETADLSIQWSALIHGRIVSNIELVRPELNFAINPSDTVKQTGKEVDWNKPIRDLMPIDINVVTFRDGTLSYRDFSTKPEVNVYIHHMSGEMRNLRNVVDKGNALPSTLAVKGDTIGGGTLAIDGRLNVLKPVPDMDLNLKLEHASLPALSNYSNAYAAIDIRGGRLDLYSEFIVKDSRVTGYIKPIATHVKLIDLRKESNPIKAAWQVVVATVVEIFTNHENDQFATKVAFEGKLDSVDTSTWSAVAGIVRNAFVEAFKRGLDKDIRFDAAPKQ